MMRRKRKFILSGKIWEGFMEEVRVKRWREIQQTSVREWAKDSIPDKQYN